MPDLGRWNGIDQLAESYLSTSPFAYVANNPISSFDVDGRWFNDGGSIGQAPTTWGLHGSQYQPMMTFSSNDGMHTNEGAGVTDNGNNGNKRIAQGPKPNIFKTIGNFVKKILGKSKRAVAGVLTVGAATFEGIGSEVEVVGSNMLRLGAIFRLGQWGLPLMLNGDSSHASGYDIPLTGAADIPVTTTADEPDPGQMITLYRGVSSKIFHNDNSQYINAHFGIAIPKGYYQVSSLFGPHNDMEAHAGGDNLSIWTSWTTSKETARDFATGVAFGPAVPGIIMSKSFKIGVANPNPFNLGEAEWLVPGVVYGAKVEYVRPRPGQ